jgi:hypothetical protein
MSAIIQPRSRVWTTGDEQAVYDNATQETVARLSAMQFDEDFIGPGHSAIPSAGSPSTGYPWVKNIVGAGPPTVAIVANSSGGIVQLALTSTSEAEEATLYQNDQLNFDGSKSAYFECLALFTTLPASGVEVVFGLRAARNAVPDSAAEYIDFQLNGSGAVNIRIKDGVTGAQSNASGITLLANAWHYFRFDTTDPTNVGFYIDGVKVSPVAPATLMTFAATGASAILQPYFSLYRGAVGTGLCTMQVDMVQAGMNRS